MPFRSSTPSDEDEEDVAIFDARMAELKVGKASILPQEVSAFIMRGIRF
jgi:hypothetical protein